MTKYIEKLLNDTGLADISNRGWFATAVNWLIDSKERTKKELDNFLKDQIANPHPDLVEVAKTFVKIKNPDKMIIEILKYVYKRVEYKTDEKTWGKVEYWADAHLTWVTKFDDCDGINALVYVLMRLASSEYINNVLYCAIGDTSSGGHFWLVYLSTKTGKWYTIDGTFYPNFTEISNHRALFKLNEKYKKIWFLFNETGAWKHD